MSVRKVTEDLIAVAESVVLNSVPTVMPPLAPSIELARSSVPGAAPICDTPRSANHTLPEPTPSVAWPKPGTLILPALKS